MWRWATAALLAALALLAAAALAHAPIYLYARSLPGAVAECDHSTIESTAVMLRPTTVGAADPSRIAEQVPPEIKCAGTLRQVAGPVWQQLGLDALIVAIWGSLYWLFLRGLRKDRALTGAARLQAWLPPIALLVWLPIAIRQVWWAMFTF